MPLPLSPEVITAMESGAIANAWLLTLYADEGILRGWSGYSDINFGGNIYEGLSDGWRIEGDIRLSGDLVPEPLTLVFDGTPANENTSFVGRLVDRSWHQRPMSLVGLLFVPGTNFITPVGTWLEWSGTMDTLESADADNDTADMIMNAEGGIFRALDTYLTTCTDLDQRLRDPTDAFFENVASKPQQDFPFGKSWSKVPGAYNGRGSRGYGGGGGGGNGGSNVAFGNF